LASAFFNEKSNALPARLALAVNTGAVSPFDNIFDCAKPDRAIRSEKLKIKKDKR
jgi:hypothetical protein